MKKQCAYIGLYIKKPPFWMVYFDNVRISVPLEWLLNGFTYIDKKVYELVASF